MKRIFTLFLIIILVVAMVPSIGASAKNAVEFTVGNATGAPGQEVTVKVSITQNPGITSAQVLVAYDAKVLEAKNINGLSLEGTKTAVGPIDANPLSMIWCNALNDITETGDIATITFKIKDNAVAGDYVLTVTSNQENVFDTKFNDVPFVTKNGYVNIINSNVSNEQTSLPEDTQSKPTSSSQTESSQHQTTSQNTTSSQITDNVTSSKDDATQLDITDTNKDSTITIGALDSSDVDADKDDNSNTDSDKGWLLWVVIAAMVVLGSAIVIIVIRGRNSKI